MLIVLLRLILSIGVRLIVVTAAVLRYDKVRRLYGNCAYDTLISFRISHQPALSVIFNIGVDSFRRVKF